jgi:hypothetical protein
MRRLALAALLVLASTAAAQAPVPAAETGQALTGKVVRITGDIEGLGIVVAYDKGAFVALRSLDGKEERQIRLVGRYKILLLAEDAEAYRALAEKGAVEGRVVEESAGTAAAGPPAPANPAAARPGVPPIISYPTPHLDAVARDHKTSRLVSGAVELLIGGIALAVSGKGDAGSRSTTLLVGGGLSVLGLKNIVFRSAAETAHDRVEHIEDPRAREQAEGDALRALATGGALRRIISGFFWLGMGGLALAMPTADVAPEFAEANKAMKYLIGIPCFGRAASSFFTKSTDEKHWRKFQEERAAGERTGWAWDLGIAPLRRGAALTLSCSF